MDGGGFYRQSRVGRRDYWTPERVEEVRKRWEIGLTQVEIGIELGVSKNAVAGVCHRYGFVARSPRKGESRMPPLTGPWTLRMEAWPDRRECLFPHGDLHDADFHFCKKPVASEGAPYCFEHMKLCFTSQRPTAQRVAA